MMPNMVVLSVAVFASYFKTLSQLTAKGELASKVKGRGLGADEYLTKPFEGVELIVRTRRCCAL